MESVAVEHPVVESFVALGEHRLRVLTSGEENASPLVYLHGVGDLGSWIPTLSALTESYRVIRPDHAGFNGSDDFPGVDSITDLAYLYLELFDTLDLERFALVGCSLGGWIAAQVAILAGDRVTDLILIDPAGMSIGPDTPNIFVMDPAESAGKTFSTSTMRAGAIARAEAMSQDAVALSRYHRNRLTTALIASRPYLSDPKLARRAGRITADSLIVWGADDQILPVEHIERWREALPTAEFAVIEGAGHLPHAEKPDEFLQLVGAFLDRNKS